MYLNVLAVFLDALLFSFVPAFACVCIYLNNSHVLSQSRVSVY